MPRGAETILLVEDDALARQVIGRKLVRTRVPGARGRRRGGGAAAARGGGAQPDLLLCDIVLPGIGARQIAGVARVRVANMRVVYLSAHPESQLAQSGLLEPGDLLLSKSLGPEEIARRLRDVLDGTVLQ